MTKHIFIYFSLFCLLFIFGCDEDLGLIPDDETELGEEVLYLTVWEYDTFDGQNVKTGAFYDYYKRGNTGSGIFYYNSETEQEDLLYEYQIIPNNSILDVYFSDNNGSSEEKKFEYGISNDKLDAITGFHNGSVVTNIELNYSNGRLSSVTKDDIVIVNDIEYDSRGNIIRISRTNGTPIHFHFKICEGQNPYIGMFKNFELYNESLISIISYVNPNFVLDVATSSSAEFDWDSHNINITAELNDESLPLFIREKRLDTDGNITSNKIIAEYEYH